MSITPKNWSEFQHYKDRAPAWIKLHKRLLDDYVFACLPVASRALAPCLWLLASEYENGEITAEMPEIAFRLRMTERQLEDALTPLIEKGFFFASTPLAGRKHNAIPEKEREIEKEYIFAEERARAKPDRPTSPTSMDKSFSPPTDWIDEARQKGGLSESEALAEWTEFHGYWLEKAHEKSGRKRDWRRTWINYVTGDICQRRVASRRRTANTAPMGQSARGSAGVVDSLRRCVDWAKDMDARGAGEPLRRDDEEPAGPHLRIVGG